jgi:hypothetical protein
MEQITREERIMRSWRIRVQNATLGLLTILHPGSDIDVGERTYNELLAYAVKMLNEERRALGEEVPEIEDEPGVLSLDMLG